MFEEAIKLGTDAYLSGEISEQQVHLARESGVAFIAAGHHATEKFGVQALGRASGGAVRRRAPIHRYSQSGLNPDLAQSLNFLFYFMVLA